VPAVVSAPVNSSPSVFALANAVVSERREFLARGLVDQEIGVEGAPKI
jgi:hypothetical protein